MRHASKLRDTSSLCSFLTTPWYPERHRAVPRPEDRGSTLFLIFLLIFSIINIFCVLRLFFKGLFFLFLLHKINKIFTYLRYSTYGRNLNGVNIALPSLPALLAHVRLGLALSVLPPLLRIRGTATL